MHRVLMIGGFRESARTATGIERLYRELVAEDREATDIVWPMEWDSSFEKIAARCARLGQDRLTVVAYSWGAGWGFKRLCEALKKSHGIDVDHAVLIDPVYRSRILPTWLPLNIVTLLAPKIRAPWGVKVLTYYRQTETVPKGSEVTGTNPQTQITERMVTGYPHTKMDDNPKVWEFVKTIVCGHA